MKKSERIGTWRPFLAPAALLLGGACFFAVTSGLDTLLGSRAETSEGGRSVYPIRVDLPSPESQPAHQRTSVPTNANVAQETAVSDVGGRGHYEAASLQEASGSLRNLASEAPAASGQRVGTESPRSGKNPPKLSSVRDVQYNLAPGLRASDAIEVNKTLRFNGTAVGSITLRVDANAIPHASPKQLMDLIPAGGVDLERYSEDFVSFERLRDAGIDLRYDAVHDAISVTQSAAR